MAQRVVIETPLYYNENIINYVAISPSDVTFSNLKQVEIVTKYEVINFEIFLNPTIVRGAMALNHYQRKKYRLKKYHSYLVCPCLSTTHSRTLFDIINEHFDFTSRIGGMKNVLEEIFGDVLLPRLYPQNFVNKTGINKTRGILLHGPPGTGKTMIARTICEILNVQPKIVRGPEIFSSFVGESERMIRVLFDDARLDQQNFGSNSKLHIIVIDELDAVCKNRGQDSLVRDTVHDSVTTQLLSEIDGMIYLDNILLIATTNMVDAIDPALLRPGRIEKVIEIELPDGPPRSDIFDIHTKELIRNGALHQDVDINNIIRRTNGMTGAHVERTIRLAIHAAMRRNILHRNTFDITEQDAEDLQVCNQDFLEALSKIAAEYSADETRKNK
ncbi:unnamed protein product [Adineta steineri]|uniref:Vesicle-fusing ATPase n=1 Tax=Adineta steineri TaxID=433720 RepID=A0A813LYY0_9BILA|nr:unnamed protein product [Adineta steineri]CAF4027673.1 unnamed protein product [Adineta steineri]